MKRILVDVDTQFDFVDPEGSLYVKADPAVRDYIAIALTDEYDAVIGSVDSHAYDAWEFQENGGPFPPHCVKGTSGWLRVFPDLPFKRRFVPQTRVLLDPRCSRYGSRQLYMRDPYLTVGENKQGDGLRDLSPRDLAREAVEGKVGLYFEKEVYSIFDNQIARPVLHEIGCLLGGNWNEIQIDVIGYCLGGYCVDAAVEGLCRTQSIQRAEIRVLRYAAAAIGGEEGMMKSKAALTALDAEWVETP